VIGEKVCPSATSSTTDPTWTGLVLNPDDRGESPSVQPYTMQVESGQSALHLHTVRLLTEGDDTSGCGDTVGPPEDEQRAARNMLRSVV